MAYIEKDNCSSPIFNYIISDFRYIITLANPLSIYKRSKFHKGSVYTSNVIKLYKNIAISNKPPSATDRVVDYRYTKIYI